MAEEKPVIGAPTQGVEPKGDTQASMALQDFLRRYRPAEKPPKFDTLLDRFRIELSTPLPEFDTKTARAYAATDLADPGKLLFAQVCQPGTFQRHRLIGMLKPIRHQYILPLVASGTVELSRPEEERFVIFHERPAGRKLSEVLAQSPALKTPQVLCDRIIAPLASAIHQFSELGASHGLINPDNIYFTDVPVLGPCTAEPCGYSQLFQYEPIERMQALPAGKGEGSAAQDYYALAVLVLRVLYGPEHFQEWTPDLLIRAILHEGVYSALTRLKEMPEVFYDFFRGMLCLDPEDRWNYQYLRPWLDGKRYNVLSPPMPAEAMRPFEFGALQASTRRELAHLFATHWEGMAEPIAAGKLLQWVSVSLRSKEIAEGVGRLSRAVAEVGSKNEMQLNEQLMRILMLLDPAGPIRIKHLAFHIDGIESLSIELHHANAQQELQFLAKFVEFNMASYWIELQRKGQEYLPPPAIGATITKLDRLRSIIRNAGLGFGLERMLYELNPDMPCLSPLFPAGHVTTLPDLLKKLDKLAPTKAREDDPVDRHIAAFLGAKLGLMHEIRLHELAAIPQLATHRALVALFLLSGAQQRSGNLQLPGLTHWLALRILPVLDVVRSRTLRQRLKNSLMEVAQLGYTQLMAELIINADYSTADQAGFSKALAAFQHNTLKIREYRMSANIDQESTRFGFTIAKGFAYLALLASIFNVAWRGM